MRHFRDRPIRQKLMLISLQASGIALLVASIGFFGYEHWNYRRVTRQRLQVLANVIADNGAAALLFDDAAAAERTLSALEAEAQIVNACIHDLRGRHVAGYDRDSLSASCPKWNLEGDGVAFESNQIVLAVPVEIDGEEIGQVLIRSGLLDYYGPLVRYASVLALLLVVSGLAAFSRTRRLHDYIVMPILDLARTSKLLATNNDYSIRVNPRGNDELGLLASSFNEMIKQIEIRDARLEQHSHELEEEIRRQTTDLRRAVDALKKEARQRTEAEERIRYLAYYDVVTGLPNRQKFTDRLVRAIQEAAREERFVGVLFLDLDRFKEINDNFGHAIGDKLLREVAVRIETSARAGDVLARPGEEEQQDFTQTVSRQGGDEFIVLLPRIREREDASRVATRILEALAVPFDVGGNDVLVKASIGIAIYPFDGEDPETLLKHADAAMYRAKGCGRGDFQYFTESMKTEALRRLSIESGLRNAIARDEFSLKYQPKVDSTGRRVIGLEALLRWKQYETNNLQPMEFIEVAEETGLIDAMGEWAIRAACEQAVAWQRLGVPPLRIAVNVSARQFRHGSLVDVVDRVLTETGLDPRLLELEITETAIMVDAPTTVAMLQRLRDSGTRVALDDFGTGYSSLSFVSRFPLDALKIDRSFVSGIESNTPARNIVSTSIAMARGLRLSIVAEGVETPSQFDFLRSQGCDELQGFLFSPPLDTEDVPEFLRRFDSKRTDERPPSVGSHNPSLVRS